MDYICPINSLFFYIYMENNNPCIHTDNIWVSSVVILLDLLRHQNNLSALILLWFSVTTSMHVAKSIFQNDFSVYLNMIPLYNIASHSNPFGTKKLRNKILTALLYVSYLIGDPSKKYVASPMLHIRLVSTHLIVTYRGEQTFMKDISNCSTDSIIWNISVAK